MPHTDAWQHAFHLTVPGKWKNDPQRPVYTNGAYQYFYLYNGDFPAQTGSSWRRVSTTDGMRFTDHGIPMEKTSQANGSLWSGCLVVDECNSAGFGEGAVVVLVTQPDEVSGTAAQAQFLWYSTDGGETFTYYSDRPVLANRGWEHYRDPKVIRVDDRWIMVLAEDTELGFYSSDDLKNWTEVSRFHEERIGMLECPDLFSMTADDGTLHWILAASPQRSDPERPDRPGTYAYWVGEFDGVRFTPFDDEPRWLDYGFDWYAAVTWPVHDEGGVATEDRRWAIGWMNNWAYALLEDTPTWTEGGYNGIDSVVRELQLARTDRGYELVSTPLRELAAAYTDVDGDGAGQDVPAAQSICARVTPTAEGAGVKVKCSDDGSRGVSIVVNPTEIRIDRSCSGYPGDGSLAVARAPWRGGAVDLEILVDRATVEVFADGGRIALSMLAFSDGGDTGIRRIGSIDAVNDLRVAEVVDTATQ